MGMAPYPQTVTLDANGSGSARIQNNNVAAVWIVRQISVRTNPVTPGATADVYQGVNYVSTSYFAGTGDTARGEPLNLNRGEYVEAQFSNGPPGGQGILIIYYDEVLA